MSLGRAMTPIFRPLKMDEKDSIAILSGLPAKEIIISTYGILYQQGQTNEKSLAEKFKASGKSKAQAFGLMIFVLIYMPCMGTLSAIRRELGSWKWVALVVFYTNALAWALAFLAVHIF